MMKIFGKKKGPSNEEKFKLLTRYSLEATYDRIGEKIPPEGPFKSVALQFEIPGTSDAAQIDIVHHADSPVQERILVLRVSRISADLQYTRITRLQGQLITQTKNGTFTPASSNLVLADCIGFWDFRHSEGGRWLDGLEKEYPDKAERIRNILLNDMKFESNFSDESTQEYLRYLIPVGSAAAGFAISRIAGANTIVQAVCTIAPAMFSYPVAGNVLHAADDSRKKEMIQNYLSQLDKYRVSIESILQDM